jgi:hypothetical protein
MRLAALFLITAAAACAAQDSSFSELRVRASVLRNPVIGHVGDDWHAGTGGQIELGTNVGRGDLGLAVGHIGYTATSGRPPFTGTLFTLAWMTPVVSRERLELTAGARLTDFRMDFDDPSLVGGLRTEEEVMLGMVSRARLILGRRFSVFVEGSYGVLMLETKTRMVLLNAGVERDLRMPDWLRGILR